MKISSKPLFAILGLTGSVVCVTMAFGQAAPPPAAPAAGAAVAGGGGGGGRGGGGPVGTFGLAKPMPEGGLVTLAIKPNALNDLDVTTVTAWELTIQNLVTAQRTAVTALSTSTWKSPANPAEIEAKIAALAKADLDLALARADGIAKLRSQLPAQKMDAVRQLLQGGGRGGRGG